MTSFYLLDNAQPNTQQWGYPRRGSKLSGTAILHTAECAMDHVGEDMSGENCANFIRTRSDYGSYHVLVDSDSIIWMAPWEYETWQDSQTNPWAVGISAAVQADYWHTIPADRRDRIYRNMATAAADFVTYMKSKGITVPIRRISGAEARAGVPGFCAHGDSGIDRHDPGAGFDWNLFFKYTTQALGGAITTKTGLFVTLTPAQEKLVVDRNEKYVDSPISQVDEKVWGTVIRRAGGNKTALQELADCKTLLLTQQATLSGLLKAIEQLAKGAGSSVDLAAVTAAAEAGAEKALADLSAVVTFEKAGA